jgi:hypothetical protein
MKDIRCFLVTVLLLASLINVRGQLDAEENYRLSFILCDELRFDRVYRVMRLDVHCYRHVAMFGDKLCIEVKKNDVKENYK